MLGPMFSSLQKIPLPVLWWFSTATFRMRPASPVASPLRGPLHDLPPTLIQVSDCEMLADNARRKQKAHRWNCISGREWYTCGRFSARCCQKQTRLLTTWRSFCELTPARHIRHGWVKPEPFPAALWYGPSALFRQCACAWRICSVLWHGELFAVLPLAGSTP